MNPGEQTPLETTIGYEQVAVDLTAWLARNEPDPRQGAARVRGRENCLMA